MQRFTFSSHDLPRRDAVEATRATYASLARLELEPLNNQFAADVSTFILPNLAIAEVATSPVTVRRTSALMSDGNDDLNLHICVGGEGLTIKQPTRDSMELKVGDVWLAPNNCTQEGVHRAPSRGLSITIPRASLKGRLVNNDLGRIEKLSPTSELHLFFHYAAALIRVPDTPTPAAAHLASTHLHDILALALGATRDEAHIAKRRGLSVARYQAVCADILTNLAEPELSLEWVAARHAISPRYLRGLFYDQQTNFSEFTRNARLDKTRDMLADPRFAHRTITAIVHEAGLGDLSGFNRMFRRRFGVTPSDLRAIARGDGG